MNFKRGSLQEEGVGKNADSVPLYLRTSNSNSQLSDDEMDLFVNSFLSAEEAARSDDEDVPLWAEGIQELDDLEGKTLQFEESVLRPIRNDDVDTSRPNHWFVFFLFFLFFFFVFPSYYYFYYN